MTNSLDDTICAIATPTGEGGIGIIRVSGSTAVQTTAAVVRLRSGGALLNGRPRTLLRADLLPWTGQPQTAPAAPGMALDDVLVVRMPAPHSYTGEDIVEIHCHGGPLIVQTACEALIRHGARLAEPGEFTKRAFLNGRLDLVQAEAVLDTIRAKTQGALAVAQAQLRGGLSQVLAPIRESLIDMLAEVEAAIDFAEEDLSFIPPESLRASLGAAVETVQRLLDTAQDGRILRDGVTVAMIGRPNVGKSSLLNALLQSNRAIVTAIPGTTRDILEEALNIRGVAMRMLDTAGVRLTDDPVEQEGVRRSEAALAEADLVLLVLDHSAPLTDDDHRLLTSASTRRSLIVLNKTDLPAGFQEAGLRNRWPGDWDPIAVSATTGSGLDLLRDRLRAAVLRSDIEPGEGPLITRLRHQTALQAVSHGLRHAIESVGQRQSPEFVAVDLRDAIEALGELTGQITTDEILDRIFREFCIGK